MKNPSPDDAPLLLSQICARWRSIALSTPILWSEINFEASEEHPKPRFELVKTWLGRSGPCPLSLDLISCPEFDTPRTTAHKAIHKVLQAIFPHISHCRDFRFNFLLDDFSSSYALPFRVPQGGAPLLENLLVILPENFKGDFLLCAPGSLPRLRSLHWEGTHTSLCALGVPWDQLTRLNLSVPSSTTDFFEMLRQCQRITHCECKWLRGSYPSTSVLDGVACLESLRSLELRGDGLGPVLSHLKLPALLDLDLYLGHAADSATHLITLLSQSSCHLTNLRLLQVPMFDDDLIKCLRYTSASLVGLFIVGVARGAPVVTDKVLTLCTLTMSGGQVLCPMLESLVFGNCISSTDGMLAAMVESRCGSSSVAGRLKKVVVRLPWGHKNDERRLKALHSQGLDVSFENVRR